MTLIEYILNRKKENFVPFEETQRGKAIFEKMKEAAAERARKDEEWERTVSTERKKQARLLKIVFAPVFTVYVGLLFYGYHTGLALVFLGAEFILSLASIAFFFIRPKFVKYPSCFMMPAVAFGCALLFFVYFGGMFGFSAAFDRKMIAPEQGSEKVFSGLEETDMDGTGGEAVSDGGYSEYRSSDD